MTAARPAACGRVLALARSPAPRQRVPGDVADLYARTLMSIFRFCLPAALCLALGKTCAAEPDAITLHVRGAAEETGATPASRR